MTCVPVPSICSLAPSSSTTPLILSAFVDTLPTAFDGFPSAPSTNANATATLQAGILGWTSALSSLIACAANSSISLSLPPFATTAFCTFVTSQGACPVSNATAAVTCADSCAAFNASIAQWEAFAANPGQCGGDRVRKAVNGLRVLRSACEGRQGSCGVVASDVDACGLDEREVPAFCASEANALAVCCRSRSRTTSTGPIPTAPITTVLPTAVPQSDVLPSVETNPQQPALDVPAVVVPTAPAPSPTQTFSRTPVTRPALPTSKHFSSTATTTITAADIGGRPTGNPASPWSNRPLVILAIVLAVLTFLAILAAAGWYCYNVRQPSRVAAAAARGGGATKPTWHHKTSGAAPSHEVAKKRRSVFAAMPAPRSTSLGRRQPREEVPLHLEDGRGGDRASAGVGIWGRVSGAWARRWTMRETTLLSPVPEIAGRVELVRSFEPATTSTAATPVVLKMPPAPRPAATKRESRLSIAKKHASTLRMSMALLSPGPFPCPVTDSPAPPRRSSVLPAARSTRAHTRALLGSEVSDDSDAETASPVEGGWRLARPERAVAVRSFVAGREDEVTLATGEAVVVEVVFDDGWASGVNGKGKRGVFPVFWVNPESEDGEGPEELV
ncbi:hypothetical protein HDU96_006949 [Phlyctochytrium bullatum]|nr:hypothetical protein HDU96_006949 [Phlyctochytrium bullatum]